MSKLAKSELDALIKFLEDARRELKKKDYIGLAVSLNQAYGRAKNLRIEQEMEKEGEKA